MDRRLTTVLPERLGAKERGMVGIGAVAAAAGVSTATVSRALSGRGHVSDPTRARVVQVAAELGYVPQASASNLATGRTRNIGVVVPYLDRWYFAGVLGGIADALTRRGYDITLHKLLADPGAREPVFETQLRRRHVDGVIAVALELDDLETRRLAQLDRPVVAIGGRTDPLLSTLRVDDAAIGRLATQHLLDLGHRRIAHIGDPPDLTRRFDVPALRTQGWFDAMTDAGVRPTDELFEHGAFTFRGGHEAAMSLLRRRDRPTAIFAGSDEMAFGAMLAAQELGLRVPDDVSFVGVDDHELSSLMGLTTVAQDPHAQGELAVQTLLATIEDDAAPLDVTLPTVLVARRSSGPPPG